MRLITNYEKKKYLERYIDLNNAINQKLLERDRVRAIAEKCTVTLTDMPRGGSSDRADDYVRLADIDNEIRADINRLTTIKRETEAAINTVQNLTLRRLLWCRHINGWGWARIANGIGKSIHMTKIKLHRRALNAVEIEAKHNI